MTTPLADASEEWIDPIFDAVISDVQRTGYFDRVNEFESKRAPGHGLTADVWVQSMAPVPAGSGLSNTSAVVLFIVRIYRNMLRDQDRIERPMMKAAAAIVRKYHDNFDFGLDPLVRNVDLLGEAGTPLNAQAGYTDLDNKQFRIYDILVPVIVNDVWPQTA